ncbi:hypothetical protein B0A52_06736 [Exophiala mesophila]|uniref:Integrase zinc-binding domain-containing protein n=1 Tax=Exophiala mesophila TaxID=212818 RepID=A0A438N1V6_EXOME|nr:hypothetical protein B0A52_06736 [Exophiala mesophila]
MTQDGLLFHHKGDAPERVCIPQAVERKILELAYDASAHAGLRRAYEKVEDIVFMLGLRRKLDAWIRACPACGPLKPSRRKPYGELQPFTIPSRPFEVLAMDFVTGLPAS